MNTIHVDVSYEQLKQALRQLPPQEKLDLWRQLDADIDRPAIARRFDAALKTIRQTYSQVSEEEVMADALKATHETRAKSRHAKNRS
ncbi:MAG: hypothetical protein WA821_20790 [Anaerolineales bacterium]